MIRKLLLLASMAVLLSGCYMVPLAFVGPATSGYSTSSILQSGLASSANFIVKKGTGKTISEHAVSVIGENILRQAYFPTEKGTELVIKRKKNFK